MGCRREAWGPGRVAWAALALVLPLALSAEPVTPPDAPSVDGTLTVAPVAMPIPKKGGKDLAHALGPEGAGAARAAIVAELRDLKAFREVVDASDAGGDYGLLVTVTSFKRNIRELGGHQGETPDSMSFDLEADCAWTRGGQPLDDVAVTIEKSIPLDGPLAKHELEGTVTAMFQELAQRAFSDLFEKRFFQPAGAVSGEDR